LVRGTLLRFSISVLLLCLTVTSWSQAQAQDYIPGEVIIKLKGKNSPSSTSQFASKMQGKMALKNSIQEMNIHRFSLKAGESVISKVQELMNDPDVEYAEPNYILHATQDSEAAGDVSSQSYSYGDVLSLIPGAGSGFVQNYASVGVDAAWASSVSLGSYSTRPIVAVVDSGVDYNHQVFTGAGAIWTNSGEIANNGVDDDGNGYIDDVRGWNFYSNSNNPMDDASHGTHVAGIVLGATQDIFASPRDSAKVQIMPLKFLGADGSGSTSDAVSAIYYAVRMGANVINNSWGGGGYSQSLHEALTYAYNHKVVIVSAAGNYGNNNDSTNMYPANYPIPGQISVAASNDYDNLAGFSNYGVSSVHVAAPGVSILSSVPGNQYKYLSGTSMATPFVAGVAALVLREAPNLTGYQVRSLISNSVTYVSTMAAKVQSQGRVSASAAVTAAHFESGTAAYLPTYKAAYRVSASSGESSSSSTGPNGCGTVSSLPTGGTPSGQGWALVLGLSLIPLIVWLGLRKRETQSRRKHDRYLMDSDIQLKVGDRELTGHMKTISEGGLSFNADALLEKGGIVTIQIHSPDGQDLVQVQGHIVWCEKNKSYGVQFDQARSSTLKSIRQWTQRLVRSGA